MLVSELVCVFENCVASLGSSVQGLSGVLQKQLGKSIKALRLDQSEEYLNQGFQSYLRDNKILSQ